MNAKVYAAKNANAPKAKELNEVELLAVAGGKKISVAEAEALPGFAIGPDIPTK